MPERQVAFHQLINTIGEDIFNTYFYRGETRLGQHFHKSCELAWCAEGSAEFRINGTNYSLAAGDWLFIEPYAVHSFAMPEGAAVYVVVFARSYVRAFAKILDARRPETPRFTCSPTVTALFREVLAEPLPFFSTREKEGLPDDLTVAVKACLYAVCREFLRTVPFQPTGTKGDERVAAAILDFVAGHFRDDVSLRTVAAAIGYNYQYVSRVFNSLFRTGFRSMLNQYRYEYALRLLLETDRSVADVAFESGFQSIRTLNRVFGQIAGTSPTDVRRRGTAR